MSATDASDTLSPNAATINKYRGPACHSSSVGTTAPVSLQEWPWLTGSGLMEQFCLPVLSNEVEQHTEFSPNRYHLHSQSFNPSRTTGNGTSTPWSQPGVPLFLCVNGGSWESTLPVLLVSGYHWSHVGGLPSKRRKTRNFLTSNLPTEHFTGKAK